MKLYDFHTHLNDPKLYSNWRKYLLNFVKVGGKGLVNIGVDSLWNKRSIEISLIVRKDKKLFELVKVFSTVGYHPSEICFGNVREKNFNEIIFELKKLYLENKDIIVGIGECGIDVHYENGLETLQSQKEFFALQCELAQEFNLPVVVHSRDDFYSTFDVLKNFKNLKIYFHCWGYGPEEIKRVLDYFPNVWIGFAGNVTYPKADNLRDSLKIIPFGNLVLETDAPYLAPQIVRGQRNEPANIRFIYQFVSKFRNIEIDKLCYIMENNFRGLYNIITDNNG